MALPITKGHLVKGEQATRTAEGWLVQQVWHIENIGDDPVVKALETSGRTAIMGSAKLARSVEYVPALGVPHDYIPNCYLIEVSPRALDAKTIEVVCKYQEFLLPGGAAIEITCGLETETTNKGHYRPPEAGQPSEAAETAIKVEYTYASDYADAAYAGNTRSTGAEVQKFVPSMQLTISQDEIALGTVIIQRVRQFVGRVNQYPWPPQTLDPADSWLCMDIAAQKVRRIGWQGLWLYNMRYVFGWRNNTQKWDASVVYISPDTGRPPEDLVTGTGWKRYRLYDQANFTELSQWFRW